MNQVESIVHKGLDVVEAGVELGLTVVSRLGSILMNQLIDNRGQYYPQDFAQDHESHHGHGHDHHGARGEEVYVEDEEGYYLTNRLPLRPGDTVSISFSMNNESITEDKTITLGLTDFVGAKDSNVVTADNFTIEPDTKTISPVDFEKFVLTGNLATEVKIDTYYGSIVVTDETQSKIPVVLVVTAG